MRHARDVPAIGLMERRRRIARSEAKSLVGVLYGVMAAHFDYDPWMLAKLKNAVHWKGHMESIEIALMRYADGEARAILSGKSRL